MIQLQIPPHLASPTNWYFIKECLTPEETLEELGLNQILPQPFHPKLSATDEKHPTGCVAASVHFLIQRAAFQSKISQSKVAKKFLVHLKKLHLAISGLKYDLRRKLTKKEKAEKAAATSTLATPQPKVVKKNQPRDKPMEQDTPKTTKGTTNVVNLDSDSDLPDPFADLQDKADDPISDDLPTQPGSDANSSDTKTFTMKKPTKPPIRKK